MYKATFNLTGQIKQVIRGILRNQVITMIERIEKLKINYKETKIVNLK